MKHASSPHQAFTRRLLFLVLALSLLLTFIPTAATAADRGTWAPNVSYAVNDTVTYNGTTYKCIQSHTSLTGWEPPVVPALWSPVQGGGGGDTSAPTVPGNVRVTSTTSSSVTIAWNASTDNVGVTGYDVYRGSALAGSTNGSTLTFTNTGLNANTSYSYIVKAKDAAGNASAASTAVSATTSAPAADQTAPSAPASLRSTATSSTSVSLAWNAATDNVGVTGYDVYRGTTLALSVTGTAATITGLTASTAYSFTVKAKDAAGNVSAASNTLSVTTSPANTGGGSLPKHTLTGYWQNFVNGATNVKLGDVPSEYDIIVVSFAEMDSAKPGGVTFSVDSGLSSALGGYTNANLISEISQKHAQGKKSFCPLAARKATLI
ncbi:hypothetical protein PghCCS26_15730 [Paenibacillus glycanilyticus]|uniref:Fibronectin type-III domain-containing protein n=1 Tax=Paenibacillus glycanilyticus TaxID=126569 RepID=A0ABQ6NK03_9BACL|nr:hypothetical protein PghCCS26_15730 [Paenibacillus glycanilyticus]